MDLSVRPPAVAGAFYPGNPAVLRRDGRGLLAGAGSTEVPAKALIVPHAGYMYSGPTAAHAYAALAGRAGAVGRVVLFGPAHRVWVPGLATTSAAAFATPLGEVPIDLVAVAAALRLPQVELSEAAHAGEHSIEVQLPFLQEALESFTLVPFVVGDATPAQVGEVMDLLWGGDETLIVVSSDLSHYLPYREAQRVDQASVAQVLAGERLPDHERACGASAINGLVEVARRRGLQARLLDLCNSGDTAGDPQRVVGYAAFAFSAAGHG
jgi:hypothetical protein